jgi:glycosyltransferase involved in cell wall biosynthesis
MQGVDGSVFHPAPATEGDGRFLIFSGGKLELRKGQDLVLRAFRILAEKYPDMALVTAWHNPWPQSLRTMAASPHVRFEMRGATWADQVAHLCAANGIDPQRVVSMPSLAPEQMARVYRMTDVGVFPNRCEGGTNLVLMEYLACGRPAIVSHTSGHRDVAHEGNALLLRQLRDLNLKNPDGSLAARWQEPSVDEIVAAVEHADHHRAALRALGEVAAAAMRQSTWERAARTIMARLDTTESTRQRQPALEPMQSVRPGTRDSASAGPLDTLPLAGP